MIKWVIMGGLCLAALYYPCDELPCWDTAGRRTGSWSETACDGYAHSGTWTGYVTEDCRFIGTGDWESVSGTIDSTTMALTGTGTIREGCGPVTMSGTFSHNLISVTGTYQYSKGGGGSFSGRIQP
jgi:hypothetical protein